MLECDVLLVVLLALGTWDDLPEDGRLLELLARDDLLELLACDDPLEEWEDPVDLLEDDDLDLSPLRDASKVRGTKRHKARPAHLSVEFLGCNSI